MINLCLSTDNKFSVQKIFHARAHAYSKIKGQEPYLFFSLRLLDRFVNILMNKDLIALYSYTSFIGTLPVKDCFAYENSNSTMLGKFEVPCSLVKIQEYSPVSNCRGI